MKNKRKKLSDIGEKGLIKRIIQKNENNFIGDDGVTLGFPGFNLIATSDMLLKSSHFPKEMTYYQMGWKAVTVNVSDLAAMGADPKGILMNIAIPDMYLEDFDELYIGIYEACKYYKTPLLGGDTNESVEEIILSGTALGTTSTVDNFQKMGFEKGDLVVITGKIAYAAIGFELLKKGIDGYDEFKSYALKPIARLEEGRSLNSEYISSLTDITDGLGSELHEMLYWNNKGGFMIYEDKIPNITKVKEMSEVLETNYLDLLFNYGEDFELVFTLKKESLERFKWAFENYDYSIIGEVNDSGKVEITLENGEVKELDNKGYEHLTRN